MKSNQISCYITLAIYFSTILHSGSSVAIVIEKTALIDCYNPETALHYDGFYLKLHFNSSIAGKKPSHILSFRPPDNMKWEDIAYKSRLNLQPSGQLELKYIGLLDEGIYTCVTLGFAIPEELKTKKDTLITVYVPPQLEVKMLNHPLKVGSSMTKVAQSSARQGKPAAKIEWIPDDIHMEFTQQQNNETTDSLTSVTSVLLIKPFKSYNLRTVRCEIWHPSFPKGFNSTTITLNVTYPPDRIRILVDSNQKNLTCTSDGNPPPMYEWIMPRGSTPAKRFGPTVAMRTPHDPARQNDTYTCIASNSAGVSQPVNVTTYEAVQQLSIAQQANVSLIVGISMGVVAFIFLLLFVYYRIFIKHGPEKRYNYPRGHEVIHRNTDRYIVPSGHRSTPTSFMPPQPGHGFAGDIPVHDDRHYFVDDEAEEFDVELRQEDFPRDGQKTGNAPRPVKFKKKRDRVYKEQSSGSEGSEDSMVSYTHPSRLTHDQEEHYDYPSSSSEYSVESLPRVQGRRYDSRSDEEIKSTRTDYSSYKKGFSKTRPA